MIKIGLASAVEVINSERAKSRYESDAFIESGVRVQRTCRSGESAPQRLGEVVRQTAKGGLRTYRSAEVQALHPQRVAARSPSDAPFHSSARGGRRVVRRRV